ncbi:Cytochrome subunit of sulfide dehydrogenase [compost metagenome]
MRSLAATCFTCHGTDGRSVGGVPPSLAGRDRTSLLQALKDFKSGKRPATIMQQQAKGYTDEQLELIAGYFASLKPAPARRD